MMKFVRTSEQFLLPDFSPSMLSANSWGGVRFQEEVVDVSLPASNNFENTDLFQAMKHVLVEGGNWQETAFYHNVTKKIKSGQRLWGCTDTSQFLDRLETSVRDIFHSMKNFGYLTQNQIEHRFCEGADRNLFRTFFSSEYHSRISSRHEILIGFNECGALIFLDGRHRLAIAKLVGIAQVPVTVAFRHRNWAEFRALLQGMIFDPGDMHIKFRHADLYDIMVPYSALLSISFEAKTRKISIASLGMHCSLGTEGHKSSASGRDMRGDG